MTINKSKLLYIVLMIIYKFSIEQLYMYNLSKIYDYLGVILDYNSYKMLISWIVFFIFMVLILRFQKDTYWFIVIQLFSIFAIIPSISLYGLKNIPTTYFLFNLIFWITFIMTVVYLSKVNFGRLNSHGTQNKNIHSTIITIIFIICTITIPIVSYLYGGFRIIIKFDDIYKYRLALREVSMSVYFDYMLPFMGTILLPICMIEYLNRKKYVFVGLTVLLALMLFSINGMKTWLFVYLIVFVVHNITKKKYSNYTITNLILFSFIIGSIVAYISSVYLHNNMLSGMIHRMTIGVQELSYYYIDYITNNQPLLLRGSILRHFFEYPYSIPIEFIIGGSYTGNFETRANNGLLGDAYSNFKLLGVIIYPYLYALTFKVLQVILNRYDYKTNYIMILILIWTAMNTSFFTWLLTGGVFIVLIIYKINSIFNQDKILLV